MKATGIVRRIDDLGRVVIPKEIRRTMRIREGDPLEIYTDRDGEVIFKKYSPIGELSEFASQYAETLHKTGGFSVAICDRDVVIACAGIPKRELFEKRLSADLESIIEKRALYVSKPDKTVLVSGDDSNGWQVGCVMPIISDGDITGCVLSLRSAAEIYVPASEIEQKLVQTAAGFLGKQFED